MTEKKKASTFHYQRGFTLVELLLALALLGLVLAGIYNFFFFTNRAYTQAEGQSISVQEANLFLLNIEKDIRSASQPNNLTTAVRVLNNSGNQARQGQRIDIYRYNSSTDQYERIAYRIDGTTLQKGSAVSNTQVSSASPQYGTINNWQTIVTNVDTYEEDEFLFIDASDDTTVTSERRLLKIDLKILDPDTNRPLTLADSCMSRSGRSTTSQIAAGDTTTITMVPVTGITIYKSGSEVTEITTTNQAQTIIVTGVVAPEDADQKNLKWTENSNWITLSKTTTASDEQLTITLTSNTGGGGGPGGPGGPGGGGEVSDRTAIITVAATDGSGVTKTLTIRQQRNRVTGVIITDLNGTSIESVTKNKNAQDVYVKAMVSPEDADNSSVRWNVRYEMGERENWVYIVKNVTTSGEQQRIQISTNNSRRSRSAVITAYAVDDNTIQDQFTITQNP